LFEIHFTIFPSTPRCSRWSLLFRFSQQNPVGISLSPHTRHNTLCINNLKALTWFPAKWK
jgi:hypothetical protein